MNKYRTYSIHSIEKERTYKQSIATHGIDKKNKQSIAIHGIDKKNEQITIHSYSWHWQKEWTNKQLRILMRLKQIRNKMEFIHAKNYSRSQAWHEPREDNMDKTNT